MAKFIMILLLPLLIVGCASNNDVSYEIENETIEETMVILKDYNEVLDTHIGVNDNRVNVNIIVDKGLEKNQAKEFGDSALRLMASKSDLKGPESDYLGELWDKYTGEIYIGYSADDVILHGLKHTNREEIKWYDL